MQKYTYSPEHEHIHTPLRAPCLCPWNARCPAAPVCLCVFVRAHTPTHHTPTHPHPVHQHEQDLGEVAATRAGASAARPLLPGIAGTLRQLVSVFTHTHPLPHNHTHAEHQRAMDLRGIAVAGRELARHVTGRWCCH